MAGVDCARGTLRGGGGGVAGVDVGAGVLGIVSFFLLEELMLALGDCDPLGVANLASRQTRLLKINTIGKFLHKCHRHKRFRRMHYLERTESEEPVGVLSGCLEIVSSRINEPSRKLISSRNLWPNSCPTIWQI